MIFYPTKQWNLLKSPACVWRHIWWLFFLISCVCIRRTIEIRDWGLSSLRKGFLSFVKNFLYPWHLNRRQRVFNDWEVFSKIPPQIEPKLQRKRHHTMRLEWYSTCSAHWYQRNSGSRSARRQAVGTPRAQNGRWESKLSKVVDWRTVGTEYMHCPLCIMHYAICIMYYALCTRHYVLCTMQGWAHRGHSGMENPRKTGVGCGATPPAIFLHRRICKLWYPKGQRRDSPEVRGTLTRNQQWWSQDSPVSAQKAWRRWATQKEPPLLFWLSTCILLYLSACRLDFSCKRDNRSNNWEQTQWHFHKWF